MPARACSVSAIMMILTISLSGCATLLRGSGDPMMITSAPTAATVALNGVEIGTTPIQMRLPAKDLQLLRFSKDGYRPATVAVSGSVGSGWVILDILCGLVPVIVDAATGSWYSRDRDLVHVTMQRASGASPDSAGADSEMLAPSGAGAMTIEAGKSIGVMDDKVTISFGRNSLWDPSLGFTGVGSCSKSSSRDHDKLIVKIRRGDEFTVTTMDGQAIIVRVIKEWGKGVNLEVRY